MEPPQTPAYAEAASLWRLVFGAAPPDETGAAEMFEIILSRLPAGAYERLQSPHLRPSEVTFPKPPRG